MKGGRRLSAVLFCLAAGAMPVYGAKPAVFPNATKYKDTGAKSATGQSGSASIEARALLGKTETDVEVTTGQLDSATVSPGKLDKVQVKLYGSNGNVVATHNYSALNGGYAMFPYDSAYRGQRFQAQANVSGIDPARTDVVTADGTVKLRPDLSVGSIQNPNRAYVDTVVTIAAVVSEQNRDVGARANCVLSADGTVIDRANGIWVDAGDSVTCEFTARFSSAGVKQLSVDVTDVVPGDYDTDNNHASAQIEIVEPPVPVSYFITAEDTVRAGHDANWQHLEWQSFDGSPSYVSDSSSSDDYETHAVGYQAILDFDRGVIFPVTVENSGASDGQTFLSANFTLGADYSYGNDSFRGTCGSSFEMARWFQVCTYRSVLNGQEHLWTHVYTAAYSGSVTYYSSATTTVTFDSGDEFAYSFNDSSDSTFGPQPQPSIGNHLDIRASVTDANATYDAVAPVDLFPVDSTYSPPDDCYSWDYTSADGRFSGYACSSFSSHTYGRLGVAFGVDRQ